MTFFIEISIKSDKKQESLVVFDQAHIGRQLKERSKGSGSAAARCAI